MLTITSPVDAEAPACNHVGLDVGVEEERRLLRAMRRPAPPPRHGEWVSSTNEQKHQRFMEHLAWADELGIIEDVNVLLQSLQRNQWEHAVSTLGEIIAEGSLGNWCVRWGCTTCASYQIRQALEHRMSECGSLDSLIDEIAAQPDFPDTDTHVWILRWLGQQTDQLEVQLSSSPAGQLYAKMLHAKQASDAIRDEYARQNGPEFVEAERARKKADRAQRHRIRQEGKTAIDQRYFATLDQNLIEAYRATDYLVFADPPLTIKVGQTNSNLAQLLTARGVARAAYITAWNPKGQACDHEANAAAQARLMDTVEAEGFEWIAGEGRGSIGNWPPEPSILILGISRTEAKRLGHKFRQNAIIWVGSDDAPELVMLMPILEKAIDGE